MYGLLKLWMLGTKSLSLQEIANQLNLSPKQTTRKLKKYEEQGWITYIPGNGRGNKTKIQWLKNMEELILENLKDTQFRMTLFKQMNSDNLSDTLVTNIISTLFSLKNMSKHTLTIPIYNTRLVMDRLELLDTESAWILLHVYSRLVDEQGNGDLAYHWEQLGQKYVFYIRPNISLHNGELMTIEQIIFSLNQSFQHEKYTHIRSKLKKIFSNENQIIVEYKGPLNELINILAQVEFCIQNREYGSGPFILNKNAEDQYKLTVNPHYYLAKPILSTIILQTIPSELTRRISIQKEIEEEYLITLERSGIFYLYYKDGFSDVKKQEIYDFFISFAKEVAQLDETKKELHKPKEFITKLASVLKVGYVVNKQKFVQLLKDLGDSNLQVTHLTLEQLKDLKCLSNYDCVIVPLYINQQFHMKDIFVSIFPNKMPIYESYRKVYYPKYFIRNGQDIFGYPNLKNCYLINLY